MIAGLELPTAGEIYIDGEEVGRQPASKRDIAFVFQMFALYPHMNVRRNISYPLVSQGMPKAQVAEKVDEVSRILGIRDILDRPVSGLSGGDRQRVALGRAIVRDPKAFMMDEPLGALDAEFREHMAEELRALHDRMGATTVYVTHDQLEAMTLADRLVVLNGGNIEQIGAPIDVYDKPASTFVASFIGSPAMNLLNVKANGEGLALENGPGLSGANTKGRDRYTLGIRPEHMEEVDGPNGGDGVLLEAVVNVLEPVGAESYIYASLAGEGPEIVVRVSSHARHEAGEKLYLKVAPENLHFFDAETGRRVD
ncbi:ABC transporter ATP-binding protein, partial [Roseibium sp.]|uniref:ABC transporter ATP-binding protein n=1 Tax=Roseibium sp. TaxID=1936156 RepID=UPI003D124C2A